MERIREILRSLFNRQEWKDIDKNSYFGREIRYVKKNSSENVFFERSMFNNEDSLMNLFEEMHKFRNKEFLKKYIHPTGSFKLEKPSKKSNKIKVYIVYYIGGSKEENSWNMCKLYSVFKFKEENNSCVKVSVYRDYDGDKVGETNLKKGNVMNKDIRELLFKCLEEKYVERLWNCKESEEKTREKLDEEKD